MYSAPMKITQRGFSLPEVLCALALFAVVMLALTGYFRVLMQGFQAQWQSRELWRLVVQQAEPEAASASGPWKVTRRQTTDAGCVSIDVTVISPAGRSGRLARLHCPRPVNTQE